MPRDRQGQAAEPTKSAMHEHRRPSVGSGAGLVGGRLRLGVEDLRVHDLRHTAGTLATTAGGSLREVMDRLGHSTTVAAVRYQHVMAARDAAIARELNRLIEDR
jgi:integrase